MSDYPMRLRALVDIVPLTTWPGTLRPWDERVPSAFRATLGSTVTTLDRELHHLRSFNTLLEVAYTREQMRLDGTPRARERPSHPGVVLTLPGSKFGALRYPSDQYVRWEDNLRAIAVTLEHLRAVDRHGVTGRGEQYAGFAALPPATANGTEFTDADAAAGFVAAHAMMTTGAVRANLDAAYRAAARRVHPDVAGGSTVLFQRLDAAMRLLRESV